MLKVRHTIKGRILKITQMKNSTKKRLMCMSFLWFSISVATATALGKFKTTGAALLDCWFAKLFTHGLNGWLLALNIFSVFFCLFLNFKVIVALDV
jgi:hypothetical protein